MLNVLPTLFLMLRQDTRPLAFFMSETASLAAEKLQPPRTNQKSHLHLHCFFIVDWATSLISPSLFYSDLHLKSVLSSSANLQSENLKPPQLGLTEVVKKPHHEYTSMKSLNEPKRGFWGSLASKAKALLDEDHESPTRTEEHNNMPSSSSETKEGITAVENRTAGIIQETRKKIKKKTSLQNPEIQADLEIQLKASRDVAMPMAAKAKLLLRELKMVKSDLAFAKQRCAQLEEENKVLRENHNGENSQTDNDDLAEKARLAHENSIYTRENLYSRGVVEYHQLTMQDVVYFDERTEEVTEVYPVSVISVSSSSDISHTIPNPQVLEFK
ncbi:hypothetical protein Bca101_081248 [Brassica carinata]